MDLPQVKDEFVQYNELMFLYKSALKEIKTRLEILRDEYKFVHQYDPIQNIITRLKSPESISAKLSRQGKNLTVENIEKFVEDVAGVRITCNYSTDIYHLVDMLGGQKDIEILNSKDYMTDPKPDGYRSYLLMINVPVHLHDRTVPVKAELQLITVQMNSWAQVARDVEATYSDYMPEELMKEVKECADLFTALDKRMISIQDEVEAYRKGH